MANHYGNLGGVYQIQGKLDKAIEFYQKSLVINEALGRKEGIAANYGNLGIVYRTQGKLDKAKHYWQKSLQLFKALKSPTAQRVQSWLDKLP
jgi:tetratricopeptide (TPR) repeat protein